MMLVVVVIVVGIDGSFSRSSRNSIGSTDSISGKVKGKGRQFV